MAFVTQKVEQSTFGSASIFTANYFFNPVVCGNFVYLFEKLFVFLALFVH